jgi:hypothetical protein
MYGNSEADQIRLLGAIYDEFLQRNGRDRVATREKVKQALEDYRAFDRHDKERLVRHVEDCLTHSAKPDLQSPYLLKGGEPRPLEKRWQR